MGGCTSKKREEAAKQKQLNKPSKKKKKSRSKVYSASMESLKDEADRVTGIPQRKTPYSRGPGSSAQTTFFGFRRRTVAPNTTMEQQSQDTTTQPPPASHVMGIPTGKCSPHFPPTPPVVVHNQHTPVLTNQPASAIPRPLTNRFGFQLSPRCTKVLNNINSQLVNTTRVDPNCNPVTDTDSTSSLEVQAAGSINKAKTNPDDLTQISKTPAPQPVKTEGRQPSRLPGPKVLIKPTKPARGKTTLKQPVVAKPVIRPSLNKSIKTEVNEMMARQTLEEAASSSSIKCEPQQHLIANQAAKQGTTNVSRTSLEIAANLYKHYEHNPPKSLAPTAKPEDNDNNLQADGNEQKVLLDKDLQEKFLDAWPEGLGDDKSSSSYSEGIEEQQFPDNLTDKSADSLVSSVSSDSCSDVPHKEVVKKSSGSLSQLSDGSSEQRDFLIDDEIADQPGLTFMAEEEGGDQYGGGSEYDEDDPKTCAPEDHTDMGGSLKYCTSQESQHLEHSTTLTNQGVDEEGGMEAKATPLDSQRKSNQNLTHKHRLNSTSTGTLSPCESLTSDDLMLDFEDSTSKPAHSSAIKESKSQSDAVRIKQWFSNTSLNKMHENLTSKHDTDNGSQVFDTRNFDETTRSWFTDYFKMSTPQYSEEASGDMENVLQGIFSPATLAKLHEDREPEQCYQVARQAWEAQNQYKGSMNSVDGSPRPALQYRSRTSSSSDVASSPRGRTYRTSPLRPPRSSTGSVPDSEEGGIRMDWNLYQGMTQDALALKTNLLRLRRLLQDAEVINPFDSSLQQSSNYYNLASCESVEKTDEGENGVSLCEENADLRRQVVFLQQQMMEKDRTIHLLQQQMSKYCTAPPQPPTACGDGTTSTEATASDGLTACAPTATQVLRNNVATQTERVRPLSTGAALSQSYPNEGGPLVSSNKSHRRGSSINIGRKPGTQAKVIGNHSPLLCVTSSKLKS